MLRRSVLGSQLRSELQMDVHSFSTSFFINPSDLSTSHCGFKEPPPMKYFDFLTLFSVFFFFPLSLEKYIPMVAVLLQMR